MRTLHSIRPRQLAAHTAVAIAVATATAAAAARTALDRLVAHGTINRSQADAIEQDVNAGSIDPQALVGDGLVTQAQMQAVGATLDQVKRSAGY